jgi:hypothetical protein
MIPIKIENQFVKNQLVLVIHHPKYLTIIDKTWYSDIGNNQFDRSMLIILL